MLSSAEDLQSLRYSSACKVEGWMLKAVGNSGPEIKREVSQQHFDVPSDYFENAVMDRWGHPGFRWRRWLRAKSWGRLTFKGRSEEGREGQGNTVERNQNRCHGAPKKWVDLALDYWYLWQLSRGVRPGENKRCNWWQLYHILKPSGKEAESVWSFNICWILAIC